MKTTLSILATAYRVFDECKMARTFNKLAQSILWNEFSARGIYATHKIDYYKFMIEWVREDSPINAVNLYGQAKVEQFLEALDAEITRNPELKKTLDKVKKEIKPLDAVAAALETEAADEVANKPRAVVAPKATKAEAPEATGKAEKSKTGIKGNIGLNLDLGGVLQQIAVEYLESDEAGIMSYIDKAIEEMKTRPVEIHIPGRAPVKMAEGRLHKCFQEALTLMTIEGQAFYQGPAGTGKTTLAEQAARALNLRFGHISCTAGMSEAHLLGRMVADGSYVSSLFVELYENGGVFLLDEIDAADANTTLILNSALANGYISVPNRKDNPVAMRHADFYIVCAANTWGAGSNEYVGRNQLDAAFLDRFVGCKVYVDYDTELEADILKSNPTVAKALWTMRDKVVSHRIRRNVSTRAFSSASKHFAAGRTPEQFFEVFFRGWTKEEINKVTTV